MIRVFIADDHVIVRNGLQVLFGNMDDIVVTGEASSGRELLESLQPGQCDMLLLDLSMPGYNGAHLVEKVRALDPQLPILVYTMHNELQTAKRVLQAGASGFVTKGSGKEILIAAIRSVAAGGHFIDPAITERMMFEKPPTGEAAAPHQRLSEREYQIMTLFARGHSLREIAEELCISDKTVSTHKTHVMRKLNVDSNAELVRYVVDHGLIE